MMPSIPKPSTPSPGIPERRERKVQVAGGVIAISGRKWRRLERRAAALGTTAPEMLRDAWNTHLGIPALRGRSTDLS